MLHSDMSLLLTVFYDIGTHAYPAVAMPPKGTPKEVERSNKTKRGKRNRREEPNKKKRETGSFSV